MSSTRTIVITGASSGIGEDTARLFASKGWQVVVGARRKEKLDHVVQDINKLGVGQAFAFSLDVTDIKSVESFVHEALAASNSNIDVLFNNAGLALGVDKLAEGSITDWETVMETNVMGLLKVTRAFLPEMISKKNGHIINMGSIASFLVYEGGGVYAASKHAVRALTKTLRLELNGLGIRVTSIDPGMVETDFSLVRLQDEARAKAVYKGLRPLTGKDIAECVLWSVDRPAHVNIDEIVVMPVAQAAPHKVHRT